MYELKTNNGKKISLPKMIIFDYGHTLIYEKDFDSIKGTESLMSRAVKNPGNLSAPEVDEFSQNLFHDIGGHSRRNGIEIHYLIFQKLFLEYLGIELSVTPEEAETLYWDNAAPGEIMPHADEIITYINNKGIRSGVISNISFSGNALAKRLNRLLPHNKFEFVIASSEYVYRKPNSILFELALRKARLNPDDVWFCGDNIDADIMGASKAGLFPVWYESGLECFYMNRSAGTTPDCEYLHITDWKELIQLLDSMQE
jgi:haloacid dehalogenase superfamily, subfamily IA, variant 1 with third motif having Dx(3-4)D or Dx(3-4)E